MQDKTRYKAASLHPFWHWPASTGLPTYCTVTSSFPHCGLSGFYSLTFPQAKVLNFIRNLRPNFTFSVDVTIGFIITIIFRVHQDYKNFERKKLVGETWFPGEHHTWKSHKHNAFYCVPCSWNLQDVVPYPLHWETEKIVVFLPSGKIKQAKVQCLLKTSGKPFLFTVSEVIILTLHHSQVTACVAMMEGYF